MGARAAAWAGVAWELETGTGCASPRRGLAGRPAAVKGPGRAMGRLLWCVWHSQGEG